LRLVEFILSLVAAWVWTYACCDGDYYTEICVQLGSSSKLFMLFFHNFTGG